MHILCPHCHNAIELVRITPRQEINCPSCGSTVSVAARMAAVVDHVDVSLKAVVTDLIHMDQTDVPLAVFGSFELPTFDLP